MMVEYGHDDHIRSKIECESKGCSEKNECEVSENANRHIRSECWQDFVKVLDAIRQTDQEEKGMLTHLHCFVRFQSAIRHGWLFAYVEQ